MSIRSLVRRTINRTGFDVDVNWGLDTPSSSTLYLSHE